MTRLDATRMGAAGGAVTGVSWDIARKIAECIYDAINKNHGKDEKTIKEQILRALGEMIIGIGVQTLSGAVGYAMLKHISEMPLEKIVAAMAVGSSAFTAGILALVLVGSCATVGCCLTYKLCSDPSATVKNTLPSLYDSAKSTVFRQKIDNPAIEDDVPAQTQSMAV